MIAEAALGPLGSASLTALMVKFDCVCIDPLVCTTTTESFPILVIVPSYNDTSMHQYCRREISTGRRGEVHPGPGVRQTQLDECEAIDLL